MEEEEEAALLMLPETDSPPHEHIEATGDSEDESTKDGDKGKDKDKAKDKVEGTEAEEAEEREPLVLVTGATGLLGSCIVRQLLRQKRQVRAFVRDVDRARRIFPSTCQIIRGNICNKESIERAMEGCSVVYHCAGTTERWVEDKTFFTRTNVLGTRNVVEVALALGVEKFIYTSSMDVFQYKPATEFDETAPIGGSKASPYQKSKLEADGIVWEALDDGLPAVILHPGMMYGPGPFPPQSFNHFLLQLYKNEISALPPGGVAVAFNEDVAWGHILAEQHAKIGSRYILAEGYYTLPEITRLVRGQVGSQGTPSTLPGWVAQSLSWGGELWASVVSRPPSLPSGQLNFISSQAMPSSAKARKELGWNPVSLPEGLQITMDFLQNYIPVRH